MKTFLYRGLLLFTFIAVFSACKKENEGPVLFVSPTQTVFSRQPGQLFEFNIQAQAQAGLKRLRVTQNFDNTITQTYLDTMISGTEVTFPLAYSVPTSGVSQIYFVFHLTDNEDRTVSTPRRCQVVGSALLTESSGHIIFSAQAPSDLNRGFRIAPGESVQVNAQTDSTTIDFMDLDPIDDDLLANQWYSPRGLKFTRFDSNGFDYANATFSSAKSSYDNATKLDVVSNIQLGDKIIIKYSDDPELYAVIDVQELFDSDGSSQDRYRFNMKK